MDVAQTTDGLKPAAIPLLSAHEAMLLSLWLLLIVAVAMVVIAYGPDVTARMPVRAQRAVQVVGLLLGGALAVAWFRLVFG